VLCLVLALVKCTRIYFSEANDVLESGSRARPEYRAAHRNFVGGPAGLLPRSDQGNLLLLETPQRTSTIS
jgi:hypothetical protein